MGTIRRQSISSSLYIYLGFAIGAVNVMVLFPRYFTPEEFGLTRLLLDISVLLATVSTFGAVPATIKFFPFYKAYLPKNKNDLPFLTVFTCLFGCILILLLATIFKEQIIRKFGTRSPLFVTHYYLLYPLTISLTFLNLFESFAWCLNKSVISNFLREVFFRLGVTVLMCLFIFEFIGSDTFLTLYSFVYFPCILLLLWILIRSGQFPMNFSISSVTRKMRQKIISFALFIFSGSVLNILSRTIDVIIISSQSAEGLKDTAVFVIASYLISIMEVPQRSIVSIATPIIAQAWKDRDIAQILSLYQKTSLNLLIIGLGIWGILFLNMDNAIHFLGDTYAPIKEIVIIMGIAKLIDLGTGLNSQILLLSKYWKIDFTTNMLFVISAIPLNYILINKYGVIGSAFANLIALSLFNGIRFFYLWKLYRLQPFSLATLYAVLLGAAAIFLVNLLPAFPNIYLDTIIRTVLYAGIFGTAIITLNISDDMNGLYKHFLQKINSVLLKRTN